MWVSREGIREVAGVWRQKGGVGGRGIPGWDGAMYYDRSRRGCGVEGRWFSLFFVCLFKWESIVEEGKKREGLTVGLEGGGGGR